MVRSDRGMGEAGCEGYDISPAASRGSATSAWADLAFPGGLATSSIYLHDSEPGSQRNINIVSRVIGLACARGGPWILAGDMNATPAEFEECYGWILEQVGARIISPGVPTHFPGVGAAREIDFFVVSSAVVPLVLGVDLPDGYGLSPHRAVRLRLRRPTGPYVVRTFATPRSFGGEKPIGCPRRPVVPTRSVMEQAAYATRDNPQPLSQAFQELMMAIETELCGVTDHIIGDRPDPRYCGRAQGAISRRRPVLPPRRPASMGQVGRHVRALAWLRARRIETIHLSAHSKVRCHRWQSTRTLCPNVAPG